MSHESFIYPMGAFGVVHFERASERAVLQQEGGGG